MIVSSHKFGHALAWAGLLAAAGFVVALTILV